jgi:hypothetical protein
MLVVNGPVDQVYVHVNVSNNGYPGAMTHSGISAETPGPRQQPQTDGTAS